MFRANMSNPKISPTTSHSRSFSSCPLVLLLLMEFGRADFFFWSRSPIVIAYGQ